MSLCGNADSGVCVGQRRKGYPFTLTTLTGRLLAETGLAAPLTASSLSSSPIPSPSLTHSSKPMPLTVPPSIKLGICGGVAGSVVNVDKGTVFVGFEASKSLYDKNDNRFAAALGDGDGESSRAIAVGEGGVIDDA